MKNKSEILNSLIEKTIEQMRIGVLIKNIKRGFINDGYSEILSDKIIRIAEIKHNEQSAYVAK